MRNTLYRLLVMFLAFALSIPNIPGALAEEAIPRSSEYINSQYVHLSNSENNLEVSFTVYGKGILNDLGAHTIIIQRSRNGSSWTNVKTFYYTDAGYAHMMGHQTHIHQSYVTYTGVSGYYYRALVKVWGGDGTSGDMSPAYTNIVQT